MPNSIDWHGVRKLYMEARPEQDPELFLQPGFLESPFNATTALKPEYAQGFKLETSLFFVLATSQALRDHLLTEEECEEIRHFARLSRITGRDVMTWHEEKVRTLLCRELAILLRDHRMDINEMLHTTKLQALFELGYDRFCDIIAQEFERVASAILEDIGVTSVAGLSSEGRVWLQTKMNELDGIFKISGRNPIRGTQNLPE